jgi:hypothetical protein
MFVVTNTSFSTECLGHHFWAVKSLIEYILLTFEIMGL